MLKHLYLGLCIAGVILPFSQFAPWVMEHGLSPALAFSEIYDSRLSLFAWLDVIVSAVVLLTFVGVESRRLGMQRIWIYWLATLTVGVSLGLPLFLFMREHHISAQRRAEKKRDAATADA